MSEPILSAPQASSLACADEIFMRCAPALVDTESRVTAAGVIDRHKGDLVVVLSDLADALEGNSRINKWTGLIETHVDPAWFTKFERVILRHTGRRIGL